MTNRDWFCLALRLFGIWLLIQSIETVVPILVYAIGGVAGANGFGWMVYMILWPLVRMAIGFVLLLFAPAITARFYPNEAVTDTTASVQEAQPLKVGIQLLAMCALLLAVQDGGGVVVGIFLRDGFQVGFNAGAGGMESGYLTSLLTCGFNLGFAAILLMWNDRVVTFIEKLRYVPERDAYEPPSVDE